MRDAWKEDGNCEECRRQKYCTKICRLAKQAARLEFRRRMIEAQRQQADAEQEAAHE